MVHLPGHGRWGHAISNLRRARAGLLVALVPLLVLARPPATMALGLPGPSVAGATRSAESYTTSGSLTLVDPRSLASPVAGRTHPVLPRHTFRPMAPDAPAQGRSLRLTAAAAATGPVAEQLAHIAGQDLNGQVQAFGQDQNSEPPDTSVAAGLDQVILTTNSSMAVFGKNGNRTRFADLNLFFPLSAPTGTSSSFLTDSQVLYDPVSNRWMISGLGVTVNSSNTPTGSSVYVAVSRTQDANQPWNVWTVSQASGIVQDQPRIGNSDDKVVMTWNDFNGNTFTGEETWVLQKSDLVAGVSHISQARAFGPDPSRATLVPAHATSAGATAFVIYNDADQAVNPYPAGSPVSAGVIAIAGTPAHGDVTTSETFVPIRSTSTPPHAIQPGTDYVDSGDDRFLSAAWSNDVLWASGNTACVPSGDIATEACLEYVQVNTASALPSRIQDIQAGLATTSLYYPALGIDRAGNMMSVFTESSATIYPSVAVSGQTAGAPNGSVTAPASLLAGAGSYVPILPNGCFGPGSERWGDYSGAATDPREPTDIWVAGEFEPTSGQSCNWGTGFGRLTYSPPAIVAMSPTSGPAAGGTTVTVAGSDFVPGVTVTFGGIAGTNVTVQSANQLTVSSPPGSGAVMVSVTSSNGPSPASSAATYTYSGGPSPSPSSSPISSPSPSPSPSPTASPSPTPSPSPSASASPTPAVSPTVSPSPAASPDAGGQLIDVYGQLHQFGSDPPATPSDSWEPGSADGGAQGLRIARGVARVPDHPAWGYTLDGYGGLHPFGGAPAIGRSGLSDYWGAVGNGGNPNAPNFDIARALAINSTALFGCVTGYVLDGYGGVHPFHDPVACVNWPDPARLHLQDYWGAAPQSNHPDHYNWDIAVALAVPPTSSDLFAGGGYVLDGYGGAHQFWFGGSQVPPNLPPGTGLSRYWGAVANGGDPGAPNYNIARGIALNPTAWSGHVSGYVLDGYGGIHPFKDPACNCPFPAVAETDYWNGRDIARGIMVQLRSAGGRGYYGDTSGAVHAFADQGVSYPDGSGPSSGYPLAGVTGRGIG